MFQQSAPPETNCFRGARQIICGGVAEILSRNRVKMVTLRIKSISSIGETT